MAVWDSQQVDGLDLATLMVAIAGVESGWNPSADGDSISTYPQLAGLPNCNGYTSFGLWQINSSHSAYLRQATGSSDPCVWAAWLHDPLNNARAADVILRYQGLSAWTDYRTGAYRRYWDQAAAAVAAARQAAQTPGGPGLSLVGTLRSDTTWLVLALAALSAGSILLGLELWERAQAAA